jgi:hypothetical protein
VPTITVVRPPSLFSDRLSANGHNDLDCHLFLCDIVGMDETLTIRLSALEKARWEKEAAEVHETLAEYVRAAVRQRVGNGRTSLWEKHLGSTDIAVPAPTNANVRRAFGERRKPKA